MTIDAKSDLKPLLSTAKAHVTPALARLHDHIVVKGDGAKVWDEDGNEFLDFTAGIGVTNLGQ